MNIQAAKPYTTALPSPASSAPPLAPPRKTTTRDDLFDAAYGSCPTLSRAQAKRAVETTLEEIVEALTGGVAVSLSGFGVFSPREKRARMGRNPRTGAPAPITPRRVVAFKPAATLSASVNHAAKNNPEKRASYANGMDRGLLPLAAEETGTNTHLPSLKTPTS